MIYVLVVTFFITVGGKPQPMYSVTEFKDAGTCEVFAKPLRNASQTAECVPHRLPPDPIEQLRRKKS
jgi:hypothetical protein